VKTDVVVRTGGVTDQFASTAAALGERAKPGDGRMIVEGPTLSLSRKNCRSFRKGSTWLLCCAAIRGVRHSSARRGLPHLGLPQRWRSQL